MSVELIIGCLALVHTSLIAFLVSKRMEQLRSRQDEYRDEIYDTSATIADLRRRVLDLERDRDEGPLLVAHYQAEVGNALPTAVGP